MMKQHLARLGLSLATLALAALTMGADYYVAQTGDDAGAGSAEAPLRTILHAVKQAGPGDTVHLVPSPEPWRESVALNTHPTWYHPGGEPGKPLTIDGHGAWITGADPCPPAGWQDAGAGLWTHVGMEYSGFLVIAGQLRAQVGDADVAEPNEVVYVGGGKPLWYHALKGQPVPAIEIGQPDGASFTLDPGEWEFAGKPGFVRYRGAAPAPAAIKRPTWVKIAGAEGKLAAARERLKPGQFAVFDKTLYIRPPEGQRPDQMEIAAVVRGNGVYLGGSTSHVVIRNFNVRHVWNDGYNIHGGCKDVAFYNCNAEDCGDEGFSAHSDCETQLDGAVYQRCDNGIFNVMRSVSVTRNVIIANCRSVGYGGDQQTRHQLENVILIDNPGQLSAPNVTARNLLIVATAEGRAGTAVGLGGECRLEGLTVIGRHGYRLMHLYGLTRATLSRCWLASPGTLHLRHDDPGILDLGDSTLVPEIVVEWGAAQPFQTLAVAAWIAARQQPATTAPAAWADTLASGQMPAELPADRGCTRDLVTRYLDFVQNANGKR